MAKLHGKNGSIEIGGVKVAEKVEWSLSMARDRVDATVFGNTNKTYLLGLPDISGSYAGFLDTAGDPMLEAATDGDAVLIELFADDGTSVGSGSGFIDATVTCNVNDGVRISGNIVAASSWTTL